MSVKNPKILIIPIDNRPVCYDLCKQVSNICSNIQLFMPPIEILGSLTSVADITSIRHWVNDIIAKNDIDVAITALDTIAYGGLISSRRITANFDEIKKNIDDFFTILKSKNKKIKTYAVSSIMRISNNNYNEEEKSYWSLYGEKIFRYSYLSHKLSNNYDVEVEAELTQLAKEIPFEIIDDYLNTRKRNFDINAYYLELAKQDYFEKIIFSQDDTAEYGLNVEEKELLLKQAKKEKIISKITVKTGADEMLLSLLSRTLLEFYDAEIKIKPLFFDENVKNIISRYEDVSVLQSVEATIKLCGAIIDNKCDIELLINAPNKIQNDLCLEIMEDEKSNLQTNKLIDYISHTKKNFAIADIKNANGADNYFLDKLAGMKINTDYFYGFSAWNTTGNTLGTVIATAIIKFIAEEINKYNDNAFKYTQFIRLLDDWAYQANVRKILRKQNNTDIVYEEMQPYRETIEKLLNFSIDDIAYTFPWNRTFEIKINGNYPVTQN